MLFAKQSLAIQGIIRCFINDVYQICWPSFYAIVKCIRHWLSYVEF